MKDIEFIYKKKKCDDSLGGILNGIAELYGEPSETFGWKFSYKGDKYGHVIYGTKAMPLTDEAVINMVEMALKAMKKIHGYYKINLDKWLVLWYNRCACGKVAYTHVCGEESYV